MSVNKAAWISTPAEYPFQVKEARMPIPGPGEIVIRNVAVSINPVDWKIHARQHGRYLSEYPFILGEDAAGIVEQVGAGVTRFNNGDRVIAHCHGLLTKNPANSAFQHYPTAVEKLTSPIPEGMAFEDAVVLPLAISTASAGLYDPAILNLPLPDPTGNGNATGKTILIWGGASSVGATAIQLAAASGATVITTASPANHDFVRFLGASQVFDYHSASVIEDIVEVLKNTPCYGVFDAIGGDASFDATSAILDRLEEFLPVATVIGTDKVTDKYKPKYG
ncbi:Dehydrogenase azaJ [Fusarium oxysporum f. sp. cubense]|uniref:Dehydrogenase azaJ n=1 Tax=Fusarium oxysporum f. sp. cubense TaxID=61366 RepID=A0A559KT95_FUSOC|nr:Dehydrogenase azaJ [Fusarium oxysporum f. sp. cubense]